MATCGDFGGLADSGQPCGRRSKSGRCRTHRDGAPDNSAPHKKAFLAAYAETGNITAAAELSKVGRTTHYDWLREDAEYAAAFEDAREQATDHLEAEARRRAVDGVEEPVGWHQGEPGGYVRKYSDTLLIFLLKGARPEKYRERLEHSGAGGGPIRTATEPRVNFYLPHNGRDGDD